MCLIGKGYRGTSLRRTLRATLECLPKTMGVVDRGREWGGSHKVPALMLMLPVEHSRCRRKERKTSIPIHLKELIGCGGVFAGTVNSRNLGNEGDF